MAHPLYTALFRTVFVRMDPESAHHHAARAIELAGRFAPTRALMAATFGRTGRTGAPGSLELFGRHLSSPLGAAAGFDKEARMVRGLTALGFSHVEIGTVTAHAQPGNEPPRLWRRVGERALVNRMGFNNSGSAAVAARLARLRRTRWGAAAVVGVNIGKTKATPPEHAAQDYALSASALARYADYLVVNVSSPNTPGLRSLQDPDALDGLLNALVSEADRLAGSLRDTPVPIFVKVAPDLAWEALDELVATAERAGVAGLIATNTTLARDGLAAADQARAAEAGGLSGAPLTRRAREVVAHLATTTGLPVIASGGIMSPADAKALFEAGASLVQLYTGFIYHGPALAAAINRLDLAMLPS